jgi:hypothetical protein
MHTKIVEVCSYSFFISAQMKMSDEHQALATLPLWQEHPLPFEYETSWLQEPVWTLWGRYESLSPKLGPGS